MSPNHKMEKRAQGDEIMKKTEKINAIDAGLTALYGEVGKAATDNTQPASS